MTSEKGGGAEPNISPGTRPGASPVGTGLVGMGVVGIALAGVNMLSLERLFTRVSNGIDAAWVVLCKQNDGIDPARIVRAVADQSGLPAEIVTDGIALAAGRIYVGALDQLTTLEEGRFRVRPAVGPPGERASLDSFLISLAQTFKERAIGVRLAFPGADGTAGETALKEHGGLIVCEWDQLLTESIQQPLIDPAGLADFVLPVEQIPAKIDNHLRNLRHSSDDTLAEDGKGLTRIAGILRNKTGHDFHGYKRNTFLRRVQRRMQVVQADDIERYAEFLRDDGDEVGHLFQDLLIGVTQFFRDTPEFELFEHEVVPKLFEGKSAADQLRVWVLGCATGEEAYSIAILLREHMATLDTVPQVQIFATDIDGRALTMARAGRYPESVAKDVTAERLARWFAREGTTYHIAKELREMCIFSQHSVIKDAPFSRVDVISCRNLLIYLMPELQERIIPLFHFALRTNGVLFLGPSENVTRQAKLFAPIDRKHRIFRRLESSARILPHFPLNGGERSGNSLSELPAIPRHRAATSLVGRADLIAERYAPAFVVLDETYSVIHFSGRTGQFLEPATGAANLNILSLVNRDLRLDLRAALTAASMSQETIRTNALRIGDGSEGRSIDLLVEPIVNPGAATGYLVLFRDMGRAADRDSQEMPDAALRRDELVQRLEGELRLTRERLQATIEELESTNEELKSSNEEYQSINEELQAANEELETSKEELQSVNEELHTVNGELSHRVSELGRANSDLKNLLESTQIATIFLDNDLRVKSFTPTVAEIFHLIDTDLGRPIVHIASRIAYPEMQDDIRRVLRTLGTIEREIGGSSKGRYLVRVLPYRSIDNFIAGVVVTFLNITATMRAEMATMAAHQRTSEILESIGDAFYALDPEMRFTFANRRALELWGKRSEEVIGQAQNIVLPDMIDAEPLRAQQRVLAERRPLHLETQLRPSQRWASMSVYPSVGGISIFMRDIHDRKLADDALHTAEESLTVALAAAEMGTWDIDLATGRSRRSSRHDRIFGFEEVQDEWTVDDMLSHVLAEDRGQFRHAYEEAKSTGTLRIEARIRRVDNREPRWIILAGRTWYENGRPARMAGIIQDATDRKRAEERQILLMTELQHRVKNILAVVRSIAVRTLRTSQSLEQFGSHFDGRLNALARTQSVMARYGADGLELEEIVREELLAQAPHDDRQAIISGPNIRLKGKGAETFALALHELATNSVKYGALGTTTGQVTIEWRLMRTSGGERLSLDWRESGVALLDPEPKRTGFGRDLLERGLPYDLGASTSLEFAPGGVRFRIEVPVGDQVFAAVEDDAAQ